MAALPHRPRHSDPICAGGAGECSGAYTLARALYLHERRWEADASPASQGKRACMLGASASPAQGQPRTFPLPSSNHHATTSPRGQGGGAPAGRGDGRAAGGGRAGGGQCARGARRPRARARTHTHTHGWTRGQRAGGGAGEGNERGREGGRISGGEGETVARRQCAGYAEAMRVPAGPGREP